MASKFLSFFSETKQELARVNWPSRDELMQSTWLVLVVTLLVAAFIGAIDLILSLVMRVVLG